MQGRGSRIQGPGCRGYGIRVRALWCEVIGSLAWALLFMAYGSGFIALRVLEFSVMG